MEVDACKGGRVRRTNARVTFSTLSTGCKRPLRAQSSEKLAIVDKVMSASSQAKGSGEGLQPQAARDEGTKLRPLIHPLRPPVLIQQLTPGLFRSRSF